MNLVELNKKADVLKNSGKEKGAIKIYKQLAGAYDKEGNIFQSGGALQQVGVCYRIALDEKNAMDWLKKALDYYERHAHKTGQGNVWRDIGLMYEYVGKYKEAEEALRKSADLLKDSDDQGSYGGTVAKMGLVKMREKQYQAAEQLVRQGLDITRQADHWFMILTSLVILAELLTLTNRLDEAEKTAREALIMLEHPIEAGHLNRKAQLIALQAVIVKRRGDKQQADGLKREILKLTKDMDPAVKQHGSGKWYFKEALAS